MDRMGRNAWAAKLPMVSQSSLLRPQVAGHRAPAAADKAKAV
jgi:hypothetical protein